MQEVNANASLRLFVCLFICLTPAPLAVVSIFLHFAVLPQVDSFNSYYEHYSFCIFGSKVQNE